MWAAYKYNFESNCKTPYVEQRRTRRKLRILLDLQILMVSFLSIFKNRIVILRNSKVFYGFLYAFSNFQRIKLIPLNFVYREILMISTRLARWFFWKSPNIPYTVCQPRTYYKYLPYFQLIPHILLKNSLCY